MSRFKKGDYVTNTVTPYLGLAMRDVGRVEEAYHHGCDVKVPITLDDETIFQTLYFDNEELCLEYKRFSLKGMLHKFAHRNMEGVV